MDRVLDQDAYELLNGMHLWHFFSLDQAIAKARSVLRKRIVHKDTTQAEVAKARKVLKRIETASFKKQVLAQPLIEKHRCFSLLPDRALGKNETFPAVYFRPDDEVFAVISPKTHYSMSPEWRPHPYFILKERVTKVSYAPRWPDRVVYQFSHTNYSIPHRQLSETLEDARRKFVALFEKETGGTIVPSKIHVIAVSAEKKARDQSRRVMLREMMDRRQP
ncbi:MAG TPA: hypothetical protein VHB93_00380 [Candidatus Paceibacterota bacterium]|nr:hypothetical protein [Candidatus Paceibacterota bacterium]